MHNTAYFINQEGNATRPCVLDLPTIQYPCILVLKERAHLGNIIYSFDSLDNDSI